MEMNGMNRNELDTELHFLYPSPEVIDYLEKVPVSQFSNQVLDQFWHYFIQQSCHRWSIHFYGSNTSL